MLSVRSDQQAWNPQKGSGMKKKQLGKPWHREGLHLGWGFLPTSVGVLSEPKLTTAMGYLSVT